MKVTLLAASFTLPCCFSPATLKAAGGEASKFLGRADNVEMLTTAKLSRMSDLRATAGDREHERNGFSAFYHSCAAGWTVGVFLNMK